MEGYRSGNLADQATAAMRSTATTDRGWIPALDGVRAAAVLAVVIHHTNGGQFAGYALANVGVSVFFSVSGFLAYYVLYNDERRFGRVDYNYFLFRRILRIWPAYLVVIILALRTFDLANQPDAEWSPLFTFTSNWHMAAFEGWPMGALSPLWSVAVEEQFYVLAPVMYWVLRSRYALPFCVAVFALSSIGRWAYITLNAGQSGNGGLYYTTFAYADTFLAGALVAHLLLGGHLQLSKAAQWAMFLVAALGLGVLVKAWVVFPPYSPSHLLPYIALTVVDALLLAAVCAPGQAAFAKVLASPPFRAIGFLSYSIYLVHLLSVPEIDGWMARFLPSPDPNDRLQVTLIVLCVVIAKALALYLVIEAPFRALKPWGRKLVATIPWPAVLIWSALVIGFLRLALLRFGT